MPVIDVMVVNQFDVTQQCYGLDQDKARRILDLAREIIDILTNHDEE